MGTLGIFQDKEECYVCHTTTSLHRHHIFEGTANRKNSEKLNFTILLCPYHHNMSNRGIHFDKELDIEVKKMAQQYYEDHIGTKEDFIKLMGRNYL